MKLLTSSNHPDDYTIIISEKEDNPTTGINIGDDMIRSCGGGNGVSEVDAKVNLIYNNNNTDGDEHHPIISSPMRMIIKSSSMKKKKQNTIIDSITKSKNYNNNSIITDDVQKYLCSPSECSDLDVSSNIRQRKGNLKHSNSNEFTDLNDLQWTKTTNCTTISKSINNYKNRKNLSPNSALSTATNMNSKIVSTLEGKGKEISKEFNSNKKLFKSTQKQKIHYQQALQRSSSIATATNTSTIMFHERDHRGGPVGGNDHYRHHRSRRCRDHHHVTSSSTWNSSTWRQQERYKSIQSSSSTSSSNTMNNNVNKNINNNNNDVDDGDGDGNGDDDDDGDDGRVGGGAAGSKKSTVTEVSSTTNNNNNTVNRSVANGVINTNVGEKIEDNTTTVIDHKYLPTISNEDDNDNEIMKSKIITKHFPIVLDSNNNPTVNHQNCFMLPSTLRLSQSLPISLPFDQSLSSQSFIINNNQQSNDSISFLANSLSSPSPFSLTSSSSSSPLISTAKRFDVVGLGTLPSSSSMIIMDEHRHQKWLDTTMSNMLLKTYTYLRQPKVLLDYKRAVQDSITRCLAMIMEEKFKIFLIGSSLTSLGSNRSDIDLCMVIYDRRGQVDERYQNRVFAECTLGRIRHILERCGLAFECKVIRANVPILKFYDHNRVEVNLNINKLVTVQNTLLLMHCCSLDSRVAPFLFTVKLWAQKNGINCAYFKSLSSYALSLMSIFFLQNVCQPPILPSFDHILDMIKASTKLFSHFHSNKMKNQQGSVLKQLYITTSADYYHLRNQSQNLVLPPPPPPPPLFIPNIPRNISRVSLVSDYHHHHHKHNHNQTHCSGSQASSQSSLSSSSSASSTCSLDSNSSLVDNNNMMTAVDLGNPTTTVSTTSTISNLHFSPNVPAAIAMTFAAQRLASTINNNSNNNDDDHNSNNGNNNSQTEINGYRNSQQEEGNMYCQQQNKTATTAISSPSLHMNYFTFYYYFYHPQHYLRTADLQHRSSLSSSDDLDLDREEFLLQRQRFHRSSPTTSIGSASLSSSPPSSSSSLDSGYHHHHYHHQHTAFDRALYDRLSLLNLSPPMTAADQTNPTWFNSLKSDFSSSDESLTANGYNHSDECDLMMDMMEHQTSSSCSSASSMLFKSPNKQSMGSLFARFIEYYSNPAIYDYVISVRTGSLMKRTDPVFARSSYTSMDTFICVEEPFNHTNTSHSVHNDFMFNFILKSFRWTRDLLQKMKMNRDDFV